MKTLTKSQWKVVMLERKAAQIKENCADKNIFNDIIPMLNKMARLERRLQKLAEHSCNGYPKPVTEYRDGKMFRYDVEDTAWRERCEKQEIRIENQVKELAKEFNLTVDFQGDPRGLMFSLKDIGGREISI